MEAANLDTSCPSWDDKTILLVDDQIDVLITIKTMLPNMWLCSQCI